MTTDPLPEAISVQPDDRVRVRIKVYGGGLGLLPPGTSWRVEKVTEHVAPGGLIGEVMPEWTIIDLDPAAPTGSLPSASSEVEEQAGPGVPDPLPSYWVPCEQSHPGRTHREWAIERHNAEQAASQVPVTEPGLDLDDEADFVIAAAYAVGLTHEQAGQLAAEYARLRASRVDQGGSHGLDENLNESLAELDRLQGRESQQPASGSDE